MVIEQKDIPRLLAECANSAMRIDVRAVRILVEDPRAVDLTAPEAPAGSDALPRAATGRGDASAGRHDAHVRRQRRWPVAAAIPGPASEFVDDEESADPVYPPVPVEVQGIIYIYNPPQVQNSGQAAGGGGGQARRPP